ncbi:MarR family winged helix-turn-helix transcriptional regulator [Alicyclobacillus acidiphilus]|uniref:MarR family winged helix-turn-helix transcriptional regulator n=1 Tax=Alicyclobacillus acidiphilus TaxID=182455 RepID=UPI0008308569|nr:MarR family transcriptional regulator [Alicyclobacillus acidiphilus]
MVDYNPLNDSIGFLLGATYRKVNQLTTLRFREYDVTPEQWIVMYCLRRNERTTQTELSRTAQKDKTTITRIIDILDRKGMVVRTSSSEDRRAHYIHLTEKGRSTVDALCHLERSVMSEIAAGLEGELMGVLHQIRHRVEQILELEQTDGQS